MVWKLDFIQRNVNVLYFKKNVMEIKKVRVAYQDNYLKEWHFITYNFNVFWYYY